MDRAERWIALADGGAGLEDFLRDNFGRVDVVILRHNPPPQGATS